jgi:hypothetical protein
MATMLVTGTGSGSDRPAADSAFAVTISEFRLSHPTWANNSSIIPLQRNRELLEITTMPHEEMFSLSSRRCPFSVEQIFNLPYRRFVIGRTLLAVGTWQVKNMR